MDTVPGNDVRPPVTTHPAPLPGTVRRSAIARPLIAPKLLPTTPGIEPTDPYIRRYWTAVLGPTAVTELLRLIVAARRSSQIRLPLRLPQLAAEGLVAIHDGTVWVAPLVPSLGDRQLRRLSPLLRAEHQRAAGA
jgi:hypothetical protein